MMVHVKKKMDPHILENDEALSAFSSIVSDPPEMIVRKELN
jgi:hypothetical protein